MSGQKSTSEYDRYRKRAFEGDKEILMDALTSTNPNATVIGIAAVVKNKPDDDDIINALKDLKESWMIIFGYSIQQMAIAALDLIGVEKYDGDEVRIHDFIESKFLFWPELSEESSDEE